MSRSPKDAGEAVLRARHIIETSSEIDQVRVAQATLLPMMGLTLEQTAQVIGRDRYWVSRARNRFIRGEPLGQHGGRRKAYFTQSQEADLIEEVIAKHSLNWRDHIGSTLRDLLAKRLYEVTRTPVVESTITDMLDRYTQRYIPGATWGSLGNDQALLTRLAEANYRQKSAKLNPAK